MFQLSVSDAERLAPEFAKPPPTELKREQTLVISQSPFDDLLRGHTNPEICRLVDELLRPIVWAMEELPDEIALERGERTDELDEAALWRLDEQAARVEQDFYSARNNLLMARLAVDRARQRTDRIREMFRKGFLLRASRRYLNLFFTAVMEGRWKHGDDHYSGGLSTLAYPGTQLPWSLATLFTFMSLWPTAIHPPPVEYRSPSRKPPIYCQQIVRMHRR